MEKDKNLISLKEASEISGYSSDYIGQLIRSGKIFGEQVYSNVVWMTTAKDVIDYRDSSKNKKQAIEKNGFLPSLKKRIRIELNIVKIFLTTFKSAFVVLLILLFLVLFLVSYIFYSFITLSDSSTKNNNQSQQELNNLKF